MVRKSPTQLAAQFGLYLSHLSDELDQLELFSDMHRLVNLSSHNHTTFEFEVHPDNNEIQDWLKKLIRKYRHDYHNFLRYASSSDAFKNAKKEASDYDRFMSKNPQVQKLIGMVRQAQSAHNMGDNYRLLTQPYLDELEAIPGYLGSGGEGDVFEIEADSFEMVVKICATDPFQIHKQITGFKKAESLSNLTPQLHYFSLAERILVMSKRRGIHLTPDLMQEAKDEHLVRLIENMHRLYKAKVSIDIAPDDILYDPEQGFSILDVTVGKQTENLFVRLLARFVAQCFMFKERRGEVFEEKGQKTQTIFLHLIRLLQAHNPILLYEMLQESNSVNHFPFWMLCRFLYIDDDSKDFEEALKKVEFKFSH